MSKWNLIFDADRCNSCNNCVISTKDEYLDNHFEGYSEPAPKQGTLWLTLKRHERGQAPMIDVTHYISTCQQCDNAPCLSKDGSGAVTKREDGIVVIDPVKAKGRQDIVETCPYGHIHWNEEQQVPQKWSFDAHLLDDGWKEPRCSQICPTEALKAVKLSDEEMQERVKKEGLTNLHANPAHNSRIWYKNSGALTSCFLGGTLAEQIDGREHCVEDATVELSLNGSVIETLKSDPFGDFKFDGLDGGGEVYTVTIAGPGAQQNFLKEITLNGNAYIGVIKL